MSINFTINGELHSVNIKDFPSDITLNTYIRNYAQLPGTKFMCLEGGCGVCIVTVRGKHPITKVYHSWAVNSCLTLLNICNDWDIITIEGLGNKNKGYHPIQGRLAHLNGTQCGYCSSGMVMNMNSLLEANDGRLTQKQIENSFGGNICRCTGYRSILDAMKSFAIDTDYEYIDECTNNYNTDIEDIGKLRICKKSSNAEINNIYCNKLCQNKNNVEKISYNNNHIWYFPENLKGVFDSFEHLQNLNYYLVSGYTGHGVYRRDENVKAFINLNRVIELQTNSIGEHLEIGGSVTLTEIMDILDQASSRNGFEYCKKIIDHIDKIANVPVRNMGTIAGNLMLKYYHNEFPSDIFLLLTSIGANIIVAINPEHFVSMSTTEFLKFNMHKCLIIKVIFPNIPPNGVYFESYKITPRMQNAHAYVNAAFLISTAKDKVVLATICYGGINENFISAKETSAYLMGKSLFNSATFTKAMQTLSLELKPDWKLPDASPEFRKLLACGLFYKFILKYAPQSISKSSNRSGGYLIERPLSSGTQIYDTKKENWPLTKPVTKLDALQQCSGEAFYMNDLTKQPKQLWAAFVHATETNAYVVRIDPTKALQIPGVVAFFSAKDIPGKNSFVTIGLLGIVEDEELFCSSQVKYHSQPVGVIVAETNDLAVYASGKVEILYEHRYDKPVLCNLEDVVKANIQERFVNGPTTVIPNINSLSLVDAKNTIKGHFQMGGQYHFSMETQTCICLPKENGIKLYSANHFPDLIHTAVANAMNIKENSIDFEILRLGGSYGGKLSRSGQVATACVLASIKLNRPIRFVQRLESNMATLGKRNACICDYTVDVNNAGKIQKFNIEFYEDFGCARNDNPIELFTKSFLPNGYENNGWTINGKGVITDAPSHTWCRAPGSLEAIAMMENIMEHIAHVVKRDPIDVRFNNIPKDSKMKILVPQFLKSTEYRKRRKDIDTFNKQNRWRKKGIAISLMRYPISFFTSFPATVTIYHHDGSVAISHGGVEVGQGLNTKVAQVAAYTLGIQLEMVTVKATNNINGANTSTSGGSITSDSVCNAVKGACEELLNRMKPIKEQLKDPTWVDIIRKCFESNVSLIANHLHKAGDLKGYDVWALCCTEVEVDVLTGNFQLNRVDILEDTGESLSPLIDVGQIEGAFIMGIGYWLTEELLYDRTNGQLLTNRTWNYKPPGAKDIPVDFRITLLQNTSNSNGFLRSKATGEPAICLSVCAVFALRHAIDSARSDLKISTDEWYNLGAPTTVERVLLALGHNIENFEL